MTKSTPIAWLTGLFLCAITFTATAQNIFGSPDWVEEAVGPAPAFSRTGLIPIDMPPYVSVKVGIDPDTLQVGKDSIVRYVVVMTNASGSVTAAYEGIRCLTKEVKTYARQGASGQWVNVAAPQWKGPQDNIPSRHAFVIADQGACNARAAPSRAEILTALKQNQKNSGRPVF